jgi:hypothetical protein
MMPTISLGYREVQSAAGVRRSSHFRAYLYQRLVDAAKDYKEVDGLTPTQLATPETNE